MNTSLLIKSSAVFLALDLAPLEPVDWNGPGELLSILDIENGQLPLPAPGHDWTCAAHVMRPDHTEPAQAHADNQLVCSGHVGAGNEKRVVIQFGEKSPVAAWGNKFDKDPHFTVYGPVAKRMFFNIARAHSLDGYGELLEGYEQCAPDGSGCELIYFLSRRGHVNDPEPAKLACSAWSKGPDIGDFECTFLMYKDPIHP